jgi:glycerophosphoryl diester phosphodiesterase
MTIKFLFFTFLLLGCSKINLGDIVNLNDGIVHVIGHGGSGFQSTENSIPENSYRGITKSVLGNNADGAEMDVQFTGDGQLALYHNDYLQVTTSCIGCVLDYNLADVISCRYRNNRYFGRYLNDKVTKVEKIIQKFSKLKRIPFVYLDVKTTTPCGLSTSTATYINNYASAITNLVQAYSAQAWVIVTTKDLSLLTAIQGLDPTLLLYYEHQDPSVAITGAINNSFQGVTLDFSTTTKDYAATAHANNLRVVLFGVKSMDSTLDALRTNPDAIMTDNIITMQRILLHR